MPDEFITDVDRMDDYSTPFFFEDIEAAGSMDLLPDDEYANVFKPSIPIATNAHEYDIAVIGSGPAGQSAAIRASQLGAKVIMFEKDMLGGRWLNSGCIPVKTYLKTGQGIVADLQGALSKKNNIVSKLTSNAARMLRSFRVRTEAGVAVLKSPQEIVCRNRTYRVGKIILCGGGGVDRSFIPGLDHPGVWTTEEVFKATEMPPKMLIIGGGSKGCELATAFAAFGSNVMLVEMQPKLLPAWDTQIADTIQRTLSEAGVKVHTGITVSEIADRNGKPYVVTGRGGVLCDKVLVATGYMSDLSFLGSLSGELEVSNGAIAVDKYFETSVPGIYAAGDITGLSIQTNAACRMAETAASNAMGIRKEVDFNIIPRTIHSSPEVASVGLSEAEALAKYGDELAVGLCQLSTNFMAMLSGQEEGFVKVLAGRKHGEIFGIHIVSANAAEMIAEPAALMRMEVTVHEVAEEMIHAHPTYSEAFVEACEDAVGKSIGKSIQLQKIS